MKVFVLYVIVELGVENIKVDLKEKLGNCEVYIDKLIEVYCFDYDKFGCCFCLIIVYKECKSVLLLDEMVDNDLFIVLKSFIKEMK